MPELLTRRKTPKASARWPEIDPNPGRLQLGMVAGFSSERWPASRRNTRPASVGIRTSAVASSAGEPPPVSDALAQAERRIAELEQKVGRQALELDFFQRALQQVEEARLRRAVLGDTTPTRSSKR